MRAFTLYGLSSSFQPFVQRFQTFYSSTPYHFSLLSFKNFCFQLLEFPIFLKFIPVFSHILKFSSTQTSTQNFLSLNDFPIFKLQVSTQKSPLDYIII